LADDPNIITLFQQESNDKPSSSGKSESSVIESAEHEIDEEGELEL